jgi:hypothetical protein
MAQNKHYRPFEKKKGHLKGGEEVKKEGRRAVKKSY